MRNSRNSKKGDLSMSVIVMAVIALLILLVLAVMVLRGMGNFNEGANECPGRCMGIDDCRPQVNAGTHFILTGNTCRSDQGGDTCCVPLGTRGTN